MCFGDVGIAPMARRPNAASDSGSQKEFASDH